MPTSLDDWSAFYDAGGSVMHAILLVACVGMVVMIERAWQLCIRLDVDGPRLCAMVRARMLDGDTTGALRLCTARRSAVAMVLHAGVIASVQRERAAVAVREALLEVEPMLTRRLPLLSSLASLAMVLGLLGTVFGLISGFTCGAVVASDARQAAIAKQISMAVHTTGFGLLVAIALLSVRLVLVHASEKLVADVRASAAKLLDVVGVAREPADSLGSPYRSRSSTEP